MNQEKILKILYRIWIITVMLFYIKLFVLPRAAEFLSRIKICG